MTITIGIMALTILSYLQEQFSSSVIDQLSSQLNESPAVTRKAVSGVLPTLLGSLADRVQQDGAEDIIQILKKGDYSKGTTPIDVAQVTDVRVELSKAVESGGDFVYGVLGNNADRVAQDIARYSGAQPSSVQSIMALAGSVLMGLLGRQYRNEGLTEFNLKSLLLGQTDTIRAALPTELSNVGDLLHFDKFPAPTGPPTEVQEIDNFSSTSLNPNLPKSTDGDRQKENVRWLRWVLFALAALVIGLIVQKCREPQNGIDGVYTDTTRRAEPDAIEDRLDSSRQNGPADVNPRP